MEKDEDKKPLAEGSDINQFLLMNTLGLSILVEVLNNARSHAQRIHKKFIKNENYSEKRACFVFVQGTGLNILIDRYGLGYDADEIRTNFFYLTGLREYIKDE